MPAMIFLCEQCGEQEAFIVDLSKKQVYDQYGSAPTCNTPQCGRELSPVISMKIVGASKDHKAQEKEYHFYPNIKQTEDDFCAVCGPDYECLCEEEEHKEFLARPNLPGNPNMVYDPYMGWRVGGGKPPTNEY